MDLKITKYSDLKNNDSLSGHNNNLCQQHHNVYEIFYKFLYEVKPKRILEIGTALGGFTNFLFDCINDLNLDTKILSYDIHKRNWYDEMILKGIDVRVENIFYNRYNNVNQEVIDYIQSEGKTIVLCDGGDKIKEFNIFAKYIKNNDFILAHDYSISKEIYENEIKDKIWNWCEITENDIAEISNKYNLKHYNQDDFSKCVWVCKRKEI